MGYDALAEVFANSHLQVTAAIQIKQNLLKIDKANPVACTLATLPDAVL